MLWHTLGLRKRDLVAATVLLSMHQFGEAMVPVIIGATISEGIAQGGPREIGWWLAILAGDFVLLSLSYRFGARANVRARQHVSHRVRMWVTGRAAQPAGGVSAAPGELLTRSASDADRVGALSSIVASTVAAGTVLVIATALLLRYSLVLGTVIPIGTVVLLVVVTKVSDRLRRHSATEQHEAARTAVLAEDLIRGLRVLKGVGAETEAAADYGRASQSSMRASLRAVSSQSNLSAIADLFTGVYLAIIAGAGGWLALSGELGLGDLVAALGLAQFLIGPLRTVAGVGATYARSLASASRVFEVLTMPHAVSAVPAGPTRSAGTTARRYDIEFRSVVTGRLRPMSFRVEAGRLTGIATDDPVLAAQIPALLAREYDPTSGQISLGGVPIQALALDELRAAVVVSPHDAGLFEATVAQNIATIAADPAAGKRATWAAFADQVIATLPDGQDTQVGERGQNLSGGQRQRVALARALAAAAPVLVLHDPTTAVDAATEDRIAERVARSRAGMTTVIVTTSPALLARCDRVILLHDGHAESGTHAEMMRDRDRYRELVTR